MKTKYTTEYLLEKIEPDPRMGGAQFKKKFVKESKHALKEIIEELNDNPNLTKNKSEADICSEILIGEEMFLKIHFKPRSRNMQGEKQFMYDYIMGIKRPTPLFGGKHEVEKIPYISFKFLQYRFLHAFGVPPYDANGKINIYVSNVESINDRNNISCCPKCGYVYQEA